MTDIDDDWDDTCDGDGYRDPDDDYYEPDWDDTYDDREPDEPDWGYQEWLAGEEEHFARIHGDGSACRCGPPLLDRIRWRISGWLRWLDMRRHPDRYDSEPPF
ncbi:MAG TPA: hypothetical protein VKU77_26630 [Streptosporangiaceae bacterium]|nr:hypothetical protein [Streptosporangiaceae bacterium]